MLIVRQSTTTRIPVRLVDSTGAGVTGILPASVASTIATVVKSDGTTTDINLVNNTNWFQISSTKAPGLYHIEVPNTALDTVGGTQLAVIAAASAFVSTVVAFMVESYYTDINAVYTRIGAPVGASISADIAEVQTTATNTYNRLGAPAGASTAADIASVYSRIGAPSGASISADIAAVDTNVDSVVTAVASIASDVTDLRDVAIGKWQIFDDGPDANRLVLYREDGVTVLKKFDLKDIDGEAAVSSIFSREPV